MIFMHLHVFFEHHVAYKFLSYSHVFTLHLDSRKNPRLISCNLIQYECIQHVSFNDHSFPVFSCMHVCTYKHKKDIKILLIKFFPTFLVTSVVLQKNHKCVDLSHSLFKKIAYHKILWFSSLNRRWWWKKGGVKVYFHF